MTVSRARDGKLFAEPRRGQHVWRTGYRR